MNSSILIQSTKEHLENTGGIVLAADCKTPDLSSKVKRSVASERWLFRHDKNPRSVALYAFAEFSRTSGGFPVALFVTLQGFAGGKDSA